MEQLVLDGVDLSDSYEVVGIKRPMPSTVPSLENVPGLDGYAFAGAELQPQPIQFTLVSKAMGYAERRRDMRQLAAVLCMEEPVRVYFGNDEGLYYEAIVSEPPDFQEFVTFGALTVTMQPLHAAMYGDTHTLTVPSGGSITFNVRGTYPAKPAISVTAVRDPSSLVWGLRLDEGDFIHVATGNAAGRKVAIDCGARILTVSGNAALPTLDSDWLELEPGQHTLTMDNGTGDATVTWQDRWL